MKQLDVRWTQSHYGGAITPTLLLAYLMVAAGAAGIYKIITSRTGKLSITGITFQWSK